MHCRYGKGMYEPKFFHSISKTAVIMIPFDKSSLVFHMEKQFKK